MLPIAGQMAGPIGLKFFVDTPGWPGGVIGHKIEFLKKYFFSNFFLFLKTFFSNFFFYGQRRAL